MNKGRAYKLPGIGLAGDWLGAWTQTYAQVDTEAGPHGFDEHYFVQQVAGLTQLAGEFTRVKPIVIDLGWGTLKSALVKLPDNSFANAPDAARHRQLLLDQYVAAFRKVEAGTLPDARTALKELAGTIAARVAPDHQPELKTLVDGQLAKLG
jgi:hypothetical protein